jgi:hypothetical protein
MADQPIAIYRDEKLWLCDGGAYSPTNRFKVLMMYYHFKERTEQSPVLSPLSADYASQLKTALDQYDKAMEEAK